MAVPELTIAIGSYLEPEQVQRIAAAARRPGAVRAGAAAGAALSE